KLIYFLLLLALILPIVFYSPITQDVFTLPKDLVFQVLITLAFILWSIKAVIDKKIYIVKTNLNYIVLSFLMINILSLSWSVDSSLGKEDLSRLVFCIILYFLIITTIRERKQIISIINVLLFLAGLEILYSISQFFGFDPIVKNIYSGRMRMLGTIGHHNFLSEYLMMIMPLMAGVYLTTTNKY
ncbi:MAG: hypothetical protein COY53_09845, partial [Elusimicrobia bacterium CG_4_10_14_0_8_um_filter_37_32]